MRHLGDVCESAGERRREGERRGVVGAHGLDLVQAPGDAQEIVGRGGHVVRQQAHLRGPVLHQRVDPLALRAHVEQGEGAGGGGHGHVLDLQADGVRAADVAADVDAVAHDGGDAVRPRGAAGHAHVAEVGPRRPLHGVRGGWGGRVWGHGLGDEAVAVARGLHPREVQTVRHLVE